MNKLIGGLFLGLLTITGCFYYGPCLDGSGSVITEVREINGFTGVSNSASFDVYVTHGAEFSVEVVAQENLLPIVETYVSGTTLNIRKQSGQCYRSSEPVEIHVTLPELEELNLAGSGIVEADMADTDNFECSNTGSGRIRIGPVTAQKMSVSNSGSGTIEIEESFASDLSLVQTGSGNIYGGTFSGTDEARLRLSSSGRITAEILEGAVVDATVSGSGRIELSGEAQEADYVLSASGRIDAIDLMVEDATAVISGSGKIFVYATGMLDVTISASGDVIYRGDPTVTSRITGSGSIRTY